MPRKWGDEGSMCLFIADGVGGMAPAGVSNPIPTVMLPTPLANPAGIVTGQVRIAVTGTAVQVGAGASVPLQNGVALRALDTNNTARAVVGSAGVTNTKDGTGNGVILNPGEGLSLGVANLNAIWVNGTAGDIFSYWGN